MPSLLASLLVVGLALPLSQPVPPLAQITIPASDLVATLAAGRAVDEANALIEGKLDLRSLGTVSQPFRCRECTFSGTIDAADVTFQEIVDLSGAVVKGDLLLTGARVAGPLILDASPGRASEMHGRTDLRLARFQDVASMDGARFLGPADSTSTQFAGNASFAEAEFMTTAAFDRARFGSMASFAGASTDGLTMERATFAGPALFGQHAFHEDVVLTGTTFQDSADFTLAEFDGQASFDSVNFERGASFRLASASSATFRGVQARGPLTFDGAVFMNRASLANLTAHDLLSLRSLRILAAEGLELDQLSAATLLLDVPTVAQVRGVAVQQEVLGLVEQSAAATGNLPLANDARFRRLTLEATQSATAYQVFDRLILRETAGYLVRPAYPLRALACLLLLGAIVRALPTWWSNSRVALLSVGLRSTAGALGWTPTIRSNLRVFASGLWSAAHQMVARRWPAGESHTDGVPSASTVALGSEFLAHKVLIVLFLLSLGNSSPTVRQIIDAVVMG